MEGKTGSASVGCSLQTFNPQELSPLHPAIPHAYFPAPAPPAPMRTVLALALFVPAAALAQPARDEAGVAEAFARLVALAHTDSTSIDGAEAAMPLFACPVENEAGRPVPGPCDDARMDHRMRVETQLALLARLFPTEPAALHPNYTTEREGDVDVHLLLFRNLEATSFALVSFTDLEGEHRFLETQVEGDVEGVEPPLSLLYAFEDLASYADDPAATPEQFTPLTVAREGEGRAWSAPGDPEVEAERRFAAAVLDALRARLLASAGDFEAVGFEWDRESEGTWYVLHVRFGADEPHAYAFLPVGDRLLLGDVD